MYLYTCVAGGYTDDHPVIVAFWQVINDFTEQQRRQLLKFVTSCSRPPLLGFTVSAVDCRSDNTTGSKQSTCQERNVLKKLSRTDGRELKYLLNSLSVMCVFVAGFVPDVLHSPRGKGPRAFADS